MVLMLPMPALQLHHPRRCCQHSISKREEKTDYKLKKVDENEKIVYTSYQKEENANGHEINVNLPCINIT